MSRPGHRRLPYSLLRDLRALLTTRHTPRYRMEATR